MSSSDDIGGLPPVSVGVVAVAVIAVAAIVAPAPAPLGTVTVGGLLLAVGLRRRWETWLAVGSSALLAGVVLAGLDSRSMGWFVASAVPAVVAWGSGRYAVRLAEQMGRAGTTRRVELVYAVTTVTVLGVGGGTSYLVAHLMTGGSSPLVLALLLVAAVAFTLALR